VSEDEVVRGEQSVKRGMRRKELQAVHDALDLLEAGVNALAAPGESEALDLVVQMRRKIIEDFSHLEHRSDLEGDRGSVGPGTNRRNVTPE
jgi:hypothetical protein